MEHKLTPTQAKIHRSLQEAWDAEQAIGVMSPVRLDLARAAGVGERTLRRIMSGRITFQNLERVLDALGIELVISWRWIDT